MNTRNKPCTCWADTNDKIKEHGLRLTNSCLMLHVTEKMDMATAQGIPTERLDGKKLTRSDPKMVTMSHCPFCGQKLLNSDRR